MSSISFGNIYGYRLTVNRHCIDLSVIVCTTTHDLMFLFKQLEESSSSFFLIVKIKVFFQIDESKDHHLFPVLVCLIAETTSTWLPHFLLIILPLFFQT